jgi:hypothetical protein
MKNSKSILLFALLLTGLQFGFNGCVAEVGPGYDRGPWYHDGLWIDGGRWDGGGRDGGGRGGIDIHPPGFRR